MTSGDHPPSPETEAMQSAFHSPDRLHMLHFGGTAMAPSASPPDAASPDVEDDERTTGFSDRVPKSLRHRPRTVLSGPAELAGHDRPFRDLDAVMTASRAGTARVSRHGTEVVNADCGAPFSAVRATAGNVVIGCSSGNTAGFRRRLRRVLGWEDAP